MDCRVWQKAHGLHFHEPEVGVSSPDDGSATEPFVETLACRGWALLPEVRAKIPYADTGFPYIEWYRRSGDGAHALGSHEHRIQARYLRITRRSDPIAIAQAFEM